MHEISIAESIIAVAELKAREAHACSIQVIALRLGEFTTIVKEALEFAFEIARQGTLAADARLQIEIVPIIVQCVVCGGQAPVAKSFCLICGECGFPLKIVSGEELQIDYVEIETEKERSAWNESQFKLVS